MDNVNNNDVCINCRLYDDCDHGVGLEETDKDQIAAFLFPQEGGVYLTPQEVSSLRDHICYVYESIEDKDIAREGSNLAAILDCVLDTKAFTKGLVLWFANGETQRRNNE